MSRAPARPAVAALAVAIAALATSAAAWIVLVARVGGVILVVSPTHGMHAGDLLAAPFVVIATVVGRIAISHAVRWRTAAHPGQDPGQDHGRGVGAFGTVGPRARDARWTQLSKGLP